MTAITDLSRMSKDELLAYVEALTCLLQAAEALRRRLQFEVARSNYERRVHRLPVLYGWAHLADTAVSARLSCGDVPRRRGPF